MQDTGDFRVYVLQMHWDMQWSFLFLTNSVAHMVSFFIKWVV